MAQANVKLTVDATNATRALQGVQNKTNSLQKSFGGLRTAIAGIGITVLAKQAVNTAANFDKLNVRLKLLTKASGTFARSQEIAANAQKAFGLSATEALEGITDITARLQPLGVGVEDIKSTFFGFNTAAKLAGASTMEASNAFRQLAQALGSGRLQGDEFRSISEQIPTLLAPISEELGVTVGELKKFASEGKLTSDVVLRALRKIETDGASSLKALVAADPTQVFKNLSNATEDLGRAFGEKLNPVVMPAVKGLTDLTLAAVEFLNSPIGTTAAIFVGIAGAVKAFTAAVTLLSAAKTILIAKFVATKAGAIAFAKASATASVATKALALSVGGLSIALNALPFVALATAIGVATTAIIKHRQEQKKFNDLVNEGSEEEVNKLLKKQEEIRKKLEDRLATLEEMSDLHLYDFGIFLELQPDEEEKAVLENNIQMAIQQATIDLEDAIDVREIRNVKLANQVLKIRRKKKMQRDQLMQQQNIQAQAQANAQAQQVAAQAEVQKNQAMAQTNAQLEQVKSNLKSQQMELEVEHKMRLMQYEFQINQQLQKMNMEQVDMRETIKEDRKDERTRMQASQQSELIDQRLNKKPPKNFESSGNDILGGDFGLGRFDPR